MRESIQDIREKLKAFIVDDVYFYAVLIVVISVLSFGLGRLSVLGTQNAPQPQIVLTEQSAAVGTSQVPTQEQQTPNQTTDNTYVASKKGTKYHLISCPGAQQMSEKNKIYFKSEAEAKAAGYTRAKNCKF